MPYRRRASVAVEACVEGLDHLRWTDGRRSVTRRRTCFQLRQNASTRSWKFSALLSVPYPRFPALMHLHSRIGQLSPAIIFSHRRLDSVLTQKGLYPRALHRDRDEYRTIPCQRHQSLRRAAAASYLSAKTPSALLALQYDFSQSTTHLSL